MSEHYQYKISVITATYNAEACILNLIKSLRNQKDKDFEWVVIDGASTDKTLEILKNIDDLNIKIVSEPDFGIYDALNKGIKECSGEYYLVAGSDDLFFGNAIQDYKRGIESEVDLVTAKIVKDHKVIGVRKGPSWLFTEAVYISNHSIGVLIKKELHQKFGYYSRKFPIAADQLFITNCCQNGAKIIVVDSVVGEFGTVGVSSVDTIGTCTEKFRVQLLTEKYKWVQYILFILKLTKRIILSK